MPWVGKYNPNETWRNVWLVRSNAIEERHAKDWKACLWQTTETDDGKRKTLLVACPTRNVKGMHGEMQMESRETATLTQEEKQDQLLTLQRLS